MGNTACGCVRTPKEDYYVDPRKAPLTQSQHKDHQGRRYFQRKKRKSELLQPEENPPEPAVGHTTRGPKLPHAPDWSPAPGGLQTGGDGTSATEPVRAGLGSVSIRGVSVREAHTGPADGATAGTPSDGRLSSTNRVELHGARSSVDEPPVRTSNLTASGGGEGGRGERKDGCLPWHGLNTRAVSLGAVERTLLGSLRGHGGPGSQSEENLSTETMWSNGPVHRGRRRARSRCDSGERAHAASGQCMSADREVTYKHTFVIDTTTTAMRVVSGLVMLCCT